MKINILYKFSKKPWGGGNQFLSNLKEKLKRKKIYTEYEKADIILFNSHHNFSKVLDLKYKFQKNKKFIHRIDGPISSYRKKGKKLDNLIFKINKYLADGTIFQSNYSLKNTSKLTKLDNKCKVIHNQENEKYFYKKKKIELKNKIKLISISWSSNILKGFDYLEYLDNHLDFNKYEMSFIGNTPIKFKNIKIYKPMSQKNLGIKIRASNIFVFTSKIEACSNTLLEGMGCGIPTLAINSSSNPEIFNGRGELFNNKKDLILKILKIEKNYNYYFNKKMKKKLSAEDEYISFFNSIFKLKKLSFFDYVALKIIIFFYKIFRL